MHTNWTLARTVFEALLLLPMLIVLHPWSRIGPAIQCHHDSSIQKVRFNRLRQIIPLRGGATLHTLRASCGGRLSNTCKRAHIPKMHAPWRPCYTPGSCVMVHEAGRSREIGDFLRRRQPRWRGIIARETHEAKAPYRGVTGSGEAHRRATVERSARNAEKAGRKNRSKPDSVAVFGP